MSAARPRPIVVAFDTATDDVVVGAARGEELLYEAAVGHEGERFPRHATALLPEVERAAEAAGGWERVDRIGIGVGPGSYTGLRIGVTTGRALAQGRGLPAAPLGTLEALAAGIAASAARSAEGSGPPAAARPCLALIDARRGEVFAQLHDSGGTPVCGPAVLAPPRLAEWLSEAGGSTLASRGEAPLAAGSGALRFARELEAAGVEVLADRDPAHRLAGRHLCRLAAGAEAAGPERVRPVYLREPDAKRWLERDRS